MHVEAYKPCYRLLNVVVLQVLQTEIHVLTVTACIHGTLQDAGNCHVSRQGRQQTHDVVWRQGVHVPGELQRGQGQAHQTQATAALQLRYRPGQEQAQASTQQDSAQRHQREVHSGPKQAACQQTRRDTPQRAFTQRSYEGIGLWPAVAPPPSTVLPYGKRWFLIHRPGLMPAIHRTSAPVSGSRLDGC